MASLAPDATVSVRPGAGTFGQAEVVGRVAPGIATTPRVAGGRRLAVVAWQDRGGFYYSVLPF